MITRKKISLDRAWGKRIDSGVRARDRYSKEWKRNRTLLTGYYGRSKGGKIVSKVGWAAYQTMVGTVFAQTPRPVIREKNAGLENTAKLLTQIATEGLEEMNSRYFTRQAIQDVFWAGFSVVMQRLDQNTIDGAPRDQQYSLMRVHPMAFVNDPKSVMPDQYDAGWAAIETYPTVRQLKEDPDFNINKQVLESLRMLNGPPQAAAYPQAQNNWNNTPSGANDFVGTSDDDEEFQVGRVMEIYDRQNKSIIYQPTGSDAIIGEKDWPIEPWYNNQLLFPWTVLYFNENPDEFWPIPEMSMIADEIEQMSVLDRYILMDAVSKWRKFIVRGDAFKGQGALAELKNAGGPSVIPITENMIGQDVRINDIVFPVPDTSVKQDVLAAAAYKKNQIHETVGAGDFASAGMRSTRSATEAAALSDFLKVRMTTRTENIDAFFSKMIRMYVLFLQDTSTEKRFVKVTDGSGIAAWHEYDKDSLKGTFDFNVVAGSSTPKNTDSARERNLALFQQIAPLVQQSGGNLQPFIEWIAPYFDMPQHKIDEVFANHKQALQQLALVFAAIHAGDTHIQGPQLMELIASAVNTGLNQQDLQKVSQMGAQQAAQSKQQDQLNGGGAGPGGGAPPPAQPTSLPGTNPSQQTQ